MYHKDMRKRIEGNEMMRKDLNLAAKMIQECHIQSKENLCKNE